jgi:hypothetical protein
MFAEVDRLEVRRYRRVGLGGERQQSIVLVDVERVASLVLERQAGP